MTIQAKLDSNPVSLIAAADLSTKLFRFGKITSTGVNVCTVAGEKADGIIGAMYKKTPAAGDAVDLYIDRVMLIEAGAAITAGDELATDAAGKAQTATAGQYVNGVALDAATADTQLIRVRPPASKAPTAGNVSNSQTGVGALVCYTFSIADAATADYDRVLAEKFEVLDVVIQKRGGAGTGTCTVTLKSGANAITDVIDIADADLTLSRPTTIDDVYSTIDAAGTLRVAVVDGGNSAFLITVIGIKRA